MVKLFALASLAVLATTSLAAAQAGGSYQESCDNIQQRGPFLSAECQTVDGDVRRTSIDLRGCRGGVNNDNGRLTCARGGGGYGGGGYGGGGYGPPRRPYRPYPPPPYDPGGYDPDDN